MLLASVRVGERVEDGEERVWMVKMGREETAEGGMWFPKATEVWEVG